MRELIYISCNLLQQYPQSHCGLDMMSETLILPTSHFAFSLRINSTCLPPPTSYHHESGNLAMAA